MAGIWIDLALESPHICRQNGYILRGMTFLAEKQLFRMEAANKKGVGETAKMKMVLATRNFLGRSFAIVAASVVATGAAATPLTLFRYEAQAQRHCPADTVVWLDFRKGIYYFAGQKRYAQGDSGSFVCREEARGNRNRRSLLGIR